MGIGTKMLKLKSCQISSYVQIFSDICVPAAVEGCRAVRRIGSDRQIRLRTNCYRRQSPRASVSKMIVWNAVRRADVWSGSTRELSFVRRHVVSDGD